MNFRIPAYIKPFFIMVIVLIVSAFLSYIPEGYTVFGIKLKKFDLFLDVRSDGFYSSKNKARTDQLAFQTASFTQTDVATDILMLAQNSAASDVLSTGAVPAPKIENVGALKNFFEGLKQAGSKKIRIGHFGDSAIEGDNISADLRKGLQAKFGGSGAGMVPITSQDVQFRTTTKITFSNNWKLASIITNNPEKIPLGMSGSVYQPVPGANVKFETTGQYGIKTFSLARIFYTSDKSFTIKYSFDNKPEVSVDLKASAGLTEFALDAKAKVKSVLITVVSCSKTNFYGISLEEANGVYLDNYPLRGKSGIELRDLDVNKLKEFERLTGYRLIILNFGLNMISADKSEFSWYEAQMDKVITTLKDAFPQASILVVSVPDKSMQRGLNNNVSDPSVIKLVEAQRRIANKAGAAYWNLYNAMGGANSMSQWVQQGLANKDQTHFTLNGAKKVADMLLGAITEAFANY